MTVFQTRTLVGLLGLGIFAQAFHAGPATILLQHAIPDGLAPYVMVAWALALVLTAAGRERFCWRYATAWAASMCAVNAAVSILAPLFDLIAWDTALWRTPLWLLAMSAVLAVGKDTHA